MNRKAIVLVKAVSHAGSIDDFSEDFDEVKLGESLSLGYLKAFINREAKEWDVTVINPLVEHHSIRELADRIIRQAPQVLGISITYQWHRNFAFSLAQLVKEKLPSVHVILGGVYPTSDWAGLLEQGGGIFDSVCRGEGELTFLELLNALEADRDWRGIPGLAYLEQGSPAFRRRRTVIRDLSTLPFPARDDLPRILEAGGVIQIEASRRCNAGCTFCDIRHTGWIGRPVSHLVDELELLAREYPGHEVWFIDNIFLGFHADRFERATQFANEIIRRGISVQFSFQDRADNVRSDVFTLLKHAGLNRVYIGIESFADTALLRWQKQTDAATNKRALHILREVGLFAQMGFLVFDDETTMEEIRQNVAALRETAVDNPYLHLSNFNQLIPYRGTHLEKHYIKKYGHAPETGDPDLWHFSDERVRLFRHFAWDYLDNIWPVTELIFHHFDDRAFQVDLPVILPTKNRCFVEHLETLYQQIIGAASFDALHQSHHLAVDSTRLLLTQCMDQWSNDQTLLLMRERIDAINVKCAAPV